MDRAEPAELPGGAALLTGDDAWLLLDGDPVASLGPALSWADRRGVTALHLLVEHGSGTMARRAGCFEPAPVVWQIEGTELRHVEPEPAPEPAAAPAAPDLDGLLVDAGLEVLVEDGIVRGEVNGLEVARVVHGTSTTGVPLDAPLLEVGVGQADRELTGMLHGNLDPVDRLARVADIVRTHRRAGAPRHPLNQLVPERWLRARLVTHPERIDMASLRPVPMAVPRPNLRDTAPAAAVGTTVDGHTAVVVCSVGVDLGLVPHAADTRLVVDPDAELVLVVPERDALPVTRAAAARLARPAQVVALEGDWRA